MENPNAPGAFKGQPWTLFDTVAARSFLLGDKSENGLAIGSRIPAINAAGEMVFFSAGRTRASVEHYTNIDQDAQMAYGLEIWQIYCLVHVPGSIIIPTDGGEVCGGEATPYTEGAAMKLAECIIQYGLLELKVGQEEQLAFPLSRFGAGGGMVQPFLGPVMNGQPLGSNVLQLPEPISIPRTQNLTMKLKLPPEVHAMIGTVAAPGVGSPLQPYTYCYTTIEDVEGVPTPTANNVLLEQPPKIVQIGLQGRRVKNTQYGQIAPQAGT